MNHMAAQTVALSHIRIKLTITVYAVSKIFLVDDDEAGSTPEDDILADYDDDERADDIP